MLLIKLRKLCKSKWKEKSYYFEHLRRDRARLLIYMFIFEIIVCEFLNKITSGSGSVSYINKK